MKNFVLALLIFSGLNSIGQLEDGTIAPDFTLTDWYGETHNLYTYLDEDKTVFVEIFAAHCPSCWGYHELETLKSMYTTYGPESSDEVMVLALEHDEWNGEDAFNGIGDPWTTQGNWLEGTPYPQFNVEGGDRTVFEDYDVTFYPVIYKICPDKTLERVLTNQDTEDLYEKVQECQTLSTAEETEIWNVYYNQDSKKVIVEHSQTVNSVTVLNLQGQTVKSSNTFENSSIDVSDLTSGIYMFQFETETGTSIEKICIY